MPDPTNDIDALMKVLDPNSGKRPTWDNWEVVIFAADAIRHHAALTALVAERDAAIKERDEARRDVCRKEAFIHLKPYYAHQNDNDIVRFSKAIAKDRGWDCFTEKEGGGA